MDNTKAIGIDLGTTHTMVAAASEAGQSAILRTREGEPLIPSVVLFAEDRTIVGREAQLRARTNPDRLAACAKHQLGQPFYSQRVAGEWLPPEVIEACILRAAQRDWQLAKEGKYGAVIAVPAHFNDAQRHALVTAAEIANLSFLDLVNEPIAAALAFAENTTDLLPRGIGDEPHYVLVYDLGGFTCEASVLRCGPNQLDLLATEHDSNLGGHDWDLRLVDYLAEPFIRQQGCDPRSEPAQFELLLQRAAQVKLALGVRSLTSLRLEFCGQSEKIIVSQPAFEEMTADLLERTLAIGEAALRQANVPWSDLRRVLLVGGATRMPMVRRALAQKTGFQPDDRVCPEEAVARGAAIYARRILQGRAAPPALRVTSVSTHSLGIEGTDQKTGRRVNKVLIPKGTPLPASVTREFASSSNSGHAMVFNVLEGEDSNPAKCLTIGRVFLRDLPADVAGEWPVEVKYEYSPSGRLSVDARVRYTDRKVRLEAMRPGGVSKFHVTRWQAAVATLPGMGQYREVRAWERTADAQPPLVLAGAGLAAPSPAPPLAPSQGNIEIGGTLTFLKRVMPFAFRRAGTDGPPPARDSAPQARESTPQACDSAQAETAVKS